MFTLHRFQNCKRLERCMERLEHSGSVPGGVKAAYQAYHFALVHKLRSAERNLIGLEQVLKSYSAPTTATGAPQFLFEANMYLDGFFYCGGSAFDILAREVLSYFGILPTGNVYYGHAKAELHANRPGDPLLPRLGDPPWKDSFSHYRNTLTHELLLATNYTISVRLDGRSVQQQAVVPLPDDPRVPAGSRTYDENPDAAEYIRNHFRRLVSHINAIYGELEPRMNTKGSLPL